MADLTPDNGTLCGFLVPWAFSPTLAGDHVVGTDFNEADTRARGVTPPSGSTLTLEPSGIGDANTSPAYYVVSPKGGVPGVDTLGVGFSTTSGSGYIGANRPTHLVGWEEQTVATSGRGWDQLALASEDLVAVSWGLSGGVFTYYAHNRDQSDGSWTQVTIATSPDGPSNETLTGVALTEAPDGNLLAYYVLHREIRAYLGCSRSTDGGGTWVQQSINVCGVLGDPTVRRVRAAHLNGQVGIWLEYDDGVGAHSLHTVQYSSIDGGITATIVEDQDGETLGDVIVAAGRYVVATQVESTDAVWIRSSASASVSVFEDDPVALTDARDADEGHGMAFLLQPDGVLWLYRVGNSGGSPAACKLWADRSVDYGETWQTTSGQAILAYNGQNIAGPGSNGLGVSNFDVSYSRGYVILVGPEVNESGTIDPNDSQVNQFYFGGSADFTPGIWSAAPTSGTGVLSGTSRVAGGKTYAPLGSLANGWAANVDTGTINRPLSAAGVTVTVGGGELARNPTGDSISEAGSSGLAGCLFKVTAGTFTFKVSIGKAATDGCAVEVSVTSAQISFAAQGASHVYVDHNQTGYIQVVVGVDAANGKARYWYGGESDIQPRTFTSGSVTNSTTSTGFIVDPRVEESSTVAIKTLWRAYFDSTGISGPAWINAGFALADLDGVPVGASRPSYLKDGIRLVGREGYSYGGPDQWTVHARGMRPKENTLPTHRPSPRQGWRSSGTSTQTLKYTLDVDNGAAMRVGSPVFGIYLDGLYGVGSVTIKDNGSTVGSATLKHDVQMTRVGYALHPTESGPRSEGVYVEQDELKGGMVDLGSSKVRKIIGNTAGTLQSGGTIDTRRAVVFVEGIDGTESSSGAYDIYPPRALIYVYERATWTRLDIVIDTSEPVGPEGYREIGLVAAGPVYCVGMLNSRQTSLAFEDGATMVTLDDGTRRSIERHPTRRRAEVSWTYSPVDVRQIREAATTPPDYVLAKTGGAVPAAMRYDAPLLVSAIYAGINGKSTPVVWLPYVPVSTGTAVHLGARALEALYGRIVGPIRRERASFGLPMQSEGFTLSTVTIEEEL